MMGEIKGRYKGSDKGRYRRIRKRRELRRMVFLTVLTSVLVLAFSISYHAMVSRAESSEIHPSFKYYTSITLESGDTLWSLAEEHVDGVHYLSHSAYMEEVCRINGIGSDSVIQAGTNLVIPYYSEVYVR